MNIREHIGILSAEVKNLSERLNRLTDLLENRLEKWDAKAIQVDILMADRDSIFSPRKVSWMAVVSTAISGIIDTFRK